MALFLLFGLAARMPFFTLFRFVFATVLMLLCIADWRKDGHGWLPTLSWVIPFGAILMIDALIDRPVVVVVALYWIGFAALMVMLISKRAARWWYEVILRRPYKN